MRGFINFIREQGIVGFAIGFLVGGAVSKLVSSFVTDIINPLLGPVLGAAGSLRNATLSIGSVSLLWGNFVANLIDFLIIALVVYYGFFLLKLNKLDKPKEKKKDK